MKFSAKEQLIIDMLADDFGFFDRFSPSAIRVRELFEMSVGRCLVKGLRNGLTVNLIGIPQTPDRYMKKFKVVEGLSEEEIQFAQAEYREFSLLYSGEIKNIVNLLYYSVVNDENWLKNVDDKGRPKKLMKTASIEVLNAETVKYRRTGPFCFYPDATRVSFPAPETDLKPLTRADEEHYANFGSDHTLVRLLTPLSLKHEGQAMENCLGDGKYDRFLGSQDELLLSIRYRNISLATLHVTNSKYGFYIKEFFGKRNLQPDSYLVEMIASQNWLSAEEYSELFCKDIFKTDEIKVIKP